MGTVDWDGTDPPLPHYSLGNLWDTDTVALRNVVKPNQANAIITVPGGHQRLHRLGRAGASRSGASATSTPTGTSSSTGGRQTATTPTTTGRST